jgi:hypothetical protein
MKNLREMRFVLLRSLCAIAALLFVASLKTSRVETAGKLTWESNTSVISDLGTLPIEKNTKAIAYKELSTLMLVYPECQRYKVHYRVLKAMKSPYYPTTPDAFPTMSYSRVTQQLRFSVSFPHVAENWVKLKPEQILKIGREADPDKGETNLWRELRDPNATHKTITADFR